MKKYTLWVWAGIGIAVVSGVLFFGKYLESNGNISIDSSKREKVESEEIEETQEVSESFESEDMSLRYHEVSLPAMMEKEYNGNDLELVRIVREASLYREYFITYTSGELTISGILNIPRDEVPEGGFPVIFLNHGYIDPAIYTNGRGLRREQDFLARQGFAVFHSDYRNHAESDNDSDTEILLRLGYVEDVINAILAVKNSDIPELSKNRFGMLGHSMGGGIAQSIMVIRPKLVSGYVLYAPVSSDARDNFNRWTSRRNETAERIAELYGLPEDTPVFWDNVSPRTFFDWVSSSVMIFHGTLDESCDIAWSRQTRDLLEEANVDVELVEYSGEYHEFGPSHTDFMQRTAEFFRNSW
jgi:dipeptidyl aminopeptidase/acylaminoacyl peptidase